MVTKVSIFWDIMPRKPLKVNGRFGALLAAYFMLVSFLVYTSTLKMEATHSSDTSFYFQRNTKRYIP
jgi:hypothetical protein